MTSDPTQIQDPGIGLRKGRLSPKQGLRPITPGSLGKEATDFCQLFIHSLIHSFQASRWVLGSRNDSDATLTSLQPSLAGEHINYPILHKKLPSNVDLRYQTFYYLTVSEAQRSGTA